MSKSALAKKLAAALVSHEDRNTKRRPPNRNLQPNVQAHVHVPWCSTVRTVEFLGDVGRLHEGYAAEATDETISG